MFSTTVLLLTLFTSLLCAQNFAIDWFTMDGGGGSSSGGNYALSGTIGQPDAGTLTGGGYTVEGGFWGIIAAVQTPGAPSLRIALTGTNTVLVAWPVMTTNFVLQENSVMGTANWVGVTNGINVVGDENQIIVSPSAGARFYRLLHP